MKSLLLLCTVQFMVVLDVTVVNVALPAIGADLSLSAGGLHWVISAYALVFGGFLLVGGRAGDLLGRRRIFLAGTALFGISSLVCSFAWNEEALIAGRVGQGLGSALVSPTAFAILTATFAEGKERNRVLGVWGSTNGAAAAAGALLGGRSHRDARLAGDLPRQRPARGPRARSRSGVARREPRRAPESRHRRRVARDCCARPARLRAERCAPVGLALLANARAARGRARAVRSLRPPRATRFRSTVAARRAQSWATAGCRARRLLPRRDDALDLLLLTLALQQVLGFSAIEAGLGLLAFRGTSILWIQVGVRLVGRIGAPVVLGAGMVAMCAGIATFTGISPNGSYAADVLPGLLVLGLAIPFLFLSVSVVAISGTRAEDAGTTSGVLSTFQWIGGAVGVALASTVAGLETGGGLSDVAGIADGFWLPVGLGAAGIVVAAGLLRRDGRPRTGGAAPRFP